MITISSVVDFEQAELTDDVTITETGGVQFGSADSPLSNASASMQFSGNHSLSIAGNIETYLSRANLGVMFAKISGGTTWYDGVINFQDDAAITIVAKNSTGYTTASGVMAGSLIVNDFGSGNSLTVSSLSEATESTASCYANATGFYINNSITFNNGIAGNITINAQGGVSSYGDAAADAVYALGDSYVYGDVSGTITVKAYAAQMSSSSAEASASAFTAGNRDSIANLHIDAISGNISVIADGGPITGEVAGTANGSAYGLYASGDVTLNSFSGNLTVEGHGGSISQTSGNSLAVGKAFGIYSYSGDIILNNAASGVIDVTAAGGSGTPASASTIVEVSGTGAGIYSHGNFTGSDLGCDINVNVTSGNCTISTYGSSYATGYGIYADGNISITGGLKGDINVTVKAGNTSAGWALSAAYGAGIQAGNQIVDSVIGNNITVTVSGSPNRVDCPASGYGVIAYEGILNTRFENDIKVTVTTSSSGSRSQAAGYGIYARERTFGNAAQQASVNNITVTVTGSGVNETDIPSIAYGIYAGYINLEVNGKISATVNGKKGYAIYIDNPGDISDTLTLRRGANLDGIVELAKGNNVVYCYGGASGIGNIQATGGTISLYLAFENYSDGTNVVNAADIGNMNSINFYITDDAKSSTYRAIGGTGYANYISETYSVKYGSSVYEVAHGVWTKLGDSDKWVKISENAGSAIQMAIRVGDNYYGAWLDEINPSYLSKIVESFDGDTLNIISGVGTYSLSSTGRLSGGIDLTLNNTSANALYGGNANANGSVTLQGAIDLTVENNSTVGVIFGGGMGTNTALNGNITTTISDSTVKTAIYGGGGITIGTAYIARNVRTTINNSNVDGYIYGGITSVIGNAAPNTLYGTTYVTISGDSVINAQVYGGNRYSSSVAGTSAVSKSANLTISGGTFNNYIFGGGMAWAINKSSTGDVISQVTQGTKIAISSATVNHEVYGGGYAAANANSTVTVECGRSIVNGGSSITVTDSNIVNLYGGGYNASAGSVVNGGASITIKGNSQIGNVYGGGNATGTADIRANSIVNDGVNITIDCSTAGSNITLANVYGGGNSGTVVNGGSTITFKGDVTGDSSLTFSGILSGAGRNQGVVNGEKSLVFSSFTGTIDARVQDFDSLVINGSTAVGFTRDFATEQLTSISFDCSNADLSSDMAVVNLINQDNEWNSGLKIDILLDSDNLIDCSKTLLSAFDGSDLTGLDGVSFELFMDGTSLGTGLIGDDAFMVTYNDYEISFGYQDDFNLKLNITSSL